MRKVPCTKMENRCNSGRS